MANGLLRESIGHYIGLGQQILVELNPNILVWDAIRMYTQFAVKGSRVAAQHLFTEGLHVGVSDLYGTPLVKLVATPARRRYDDPLTVHVITHRKILAFSAYVTMSRRCWERIWKVS